MADFNRRAESPEERAERQEIEASTKVSSYLDNVYEAISTGNMNAARANVPNYSSGNRSNMYAHESGGEPMNLDGFVGTAAAILGEDGVNVALQDTYRPNPDGNYTFANSSTEQQEEQPAQSPAKAGTRVTENQFRAIVKFPEIVEFLGSEKGSKVANRIRADINHLLAEQIEKNTKVSHEYARSCVAQNQFIHHFFQGDGWACKVTASGPFRGDESFYYHQPEDKSFILRKIGNRYEDVSASFNVTHDYREVEDETSNTE